MTPRIGAPVLCVLSLVVALSCTGARGSTASCFTTMQSQTMDEVTYEIQKLVLRGARGESFCRTSSCERSESQPHQVASIHGPAYTCETIADTYKGDLKICGPCKCLRYDTIGNALNDILAQCMKTYDGQVFVGGLASVDEYLVIIPDVVFGQ